jgi:amidase
LVREGSVSAKELAQLALAGVEKVNPTLNSVIEVYRERVEELDEAALPDGPFRGVPFFLKDLGPLGPLEAGKKSEGGSRLTKG